MILVCRYQKVCKSYVLSILYDYVIILDCSMFNGGQFNKRYQSFLSITYTFFT